MPLSSTLTRLRSAARARGAILSAYAGWRDWILKGDNQCKVRLNAACRPKAAPNFATPASCVLLMSEKGKSYHARGTR